LGNGRIIEFGIEVACHGRLQQRAHHKHEPEPEGRREVHGDADAYSKMTRNSRVLEDVEESAGKQRFRST